MGGGWGGGGVVLKREGITNTNPSLSKVSFLSVCGMCVLLIYTISINIRCVSQERFSLVESNQQIYDFYK